MRWVWLLCLVACSDSQKPADPPATGPAVGVSVAARPSEPIEFGAPPAPAVAKPAGPVRLWNARPGVPIAAVFATADGSAAVSIDASNHARLWPTLDGKREPWVVPLTMPVEVAVTRDGDGFALAALDDSGGMELVTIAAAGELTTRLKQPPEPGFAAVIANAAGFLVLRRDQQLQQLDSHGEVRATLHPSPGEHVLKLLHRGGRTLALVRAKDGVRGRWLATDQLAWADATPKLNLNLERVFVSPDHERLVTFRETDDVGRVTLIIDLDTGRSRSLAADLSYNPPLGVPIGFASDGRIVLAFSDFELSTLEWWKPSGHPNAQIGGTTYTLETVAVENAVVTDTNVIAFAEHELAITTANTASAPTQVKFLGYRTTRAKRVESSPIGVIATIGGTALLLDEHVRVDQRVPALQTVPLTKDLAVLNFTTSDWGEPVVNVSNGIDPDWLLDSAAKPKRNHSAPRVALFDLTTKQELQRWRSAKRIHFEPASQLLAMQRGSKITFAQFDPAARKFGADQTIAASVDHVMLLDPTLAGGNVAMLVRKRGQSLDAFAVRDLTEPLPAPLQLTGKLEAIDRAGRIYTRVDDDTIVVHGGTAEARLSGLNGWTVRPSATGGQIAAFARSRLMLLDAQGRTVWSVGFPGVTDVTWAPDGTLIVLAGDLAKLDASTGRVVAAQCGWGFALRKQRPQPVDFPSTTETLCDQ